MYSLNEPYSRVYIVYRIQHEAKQSPLTEWMQAELTTTEIGTTRTFTWYRPSEYDRYHILFYIAGRYWEEEGPDNYKRYIATRPAGGYVTATPDPTEPLSVHANPGRYYLWASPHGELTLVTEDENDSCTP